MKEKFVNLEFAQILQKKQGYEFAVVKNPEYVYPEFELLPLAKKISSPGYLLSAAVMDMDGTTTTTEPLCLHSLEYMIRQMSGKIDKSEWNGLDKAIDYPHIIGNSTTKHVEFLVKRYFNYLNIGYITSAYIKAAVWTLLAGKDSRRKEEVKSNLRIFGLSGLIEFTQNLMQIEENFSLIRIENIVADAIKNFAPKFKNEGFVQQVKAGIDIYYHRYHYILGKIAEGKSREISEEVFGSPDIKMIEPMPGIEVFLPLVKGWLGNEAANLAPKLIEDFYNKHPHTNRKINVEDVSEILVKLSQKFVSNPLKVAIVTSSIFYEANIVMNEVFSILADRVDNLDLSDDLKEKIRQKYTSYKNYYDAFITASSTNEIRLKPHRDLYSIALHELGIQREMFDTVIGFEDSESGTIAIRAAGIGLCIAVPFAETTGHDLSAASYISLGGIPEVIIDKKLYTEI